MGPSISLTARLDRLIDLAALLDERATILHVNDAWVQFAEQNGYDGPEFTGQNFFGVCQPAVAIKEPGAAASCAVLYEVLRGRKCSRRVTSPCHSPTQYRWFTSWARPLDALYRPAVAIIGYRDSTERHHATRADRMMEKCSDCNLELPLLRPDRNDVAVTWYCASCGAQYLGVFDDLADESIRANVRSA